MPHQPNVFTSPLNNPGRGQDVNERNVLGALPFELGSTFSDISRDGLFSQEDIGNIFGARRRVGQAQRSSLGRGLRSSLGRRLGSRSGAVNTLITNRVAAPSLLAEQRDLGSLLQRNVESRGVGLQGLQSILAFLEQRKNNRLDREQADSGGLLDFLGPILNIAQSIPGPQQIPAAAANVGRRQFD